MRTPRFVFATAVVLALGAGVATSASVSHPLTDSSASPEVRTNPYHETRSRQSSSAAMTVSGTPLSVTDSSSAPPELPVTNGPIYALAASDAAIYLGGQFTYVGAFSGHFAAFDPTAGHRTSTEPVVDGAIFGVADDGSGGWYIGGRFSSVGGLPRSNLAHIRADRSVDPLWAPRANGYVAAVVVRNATVYVAGGFSSIDDQPRGFVAAVDTASGALRAWNPGANAEVDALAVTDSRIFAGGEFDTIGGKPHTALAAIDFDGNVDESWTPLFSSDPHDPLGTVVYALRVAGPYLYVGGHFQQVAGSPRLNAAAFTLPDAALAGWNPRAGREASEESVNSIEADETTVYLGGTFTMVDAQSRSGLASVVSAGANVADGYVKPLTVSGLFAVWTLLRRGETLYIGGDFQRSGDTSIRNNAAAIDLSSGTLTNWNPMASDSVTALWSDDTHDEILAGGWFQSVGGQRRVGFAALDRTTKALLDWDPGFDGSVTVLALDHSTLYASGFFQRVAGLSRSFLAALDTTTRTVTPWDPKSDGDAATLAFSPDGSIVYLGGWFSNLGGEVRNQIGAVRANDGTVTSWNPDSYGPSQHFDDGATIPGGVVVALDVSPDGNIVYAGGWFTRIGGAFRYRLAALNATDGHATSWNPDPEDSDPRILAVRSIHATADQVYVSGGFSGIGGQSRHALASLRADSGAATSWAPPIDGVVGTMRIEGSVVYAGVIAGSGDPYTYSLFAVDSATGGTSSVSSGDGPFLAFALKGNNLYVGGYFTRFGGRERPYFAQLNLVPQKRRAVRANAP